MTEWCVVHKDVFFGNALGHQVGFEDVIGGTRVHIVGAEQCEFLDAQFFEEVIHRRNRLLVGGGTGVEHVLGRFLTLILHGVEQQTVQLFDDGQHGFARHGCPVAKDHVDFVHGQQLACFLSKQWPVRGRVNHDRLDLTAQYAAFFVLRVDQHQHGVFQRRLGNRHGPRQRVQHADLDRIGTVLRHHQRGGAHQCGGRAGGEFGECCHLLSPVGAATPRVRTHFSGAPKHVRQEAQHIVVIVAWLVTSARIAGRATVLPFSAQSQDA